MNFENPFRVKVLQMYCSKKGPSSDVFICKPCFYFTISFHYLFHIILFIFHFPEEGITKSFSCARTLVGQNVFIQLVGVEGSLSLCEVEIFTTDGQWIFQYLI